MTNVPDTANTGAMVGIPLWLAIAVAVVAVVAVWSAALLFLECQHRDKTIAWATARIVDLERELREANRLNGDMSKTFDQHVRQAIGLTRPLMDTTLFRPRGWRP